MAKENILDWGITLDQLTDQMREEIRKSLDKYFDFLQTTVSSYPLGDTELGGKAKDCAEKHITLTRDYLHKLSRTSSLLEVMPIQAEFMQSQFSSLGEQIKTLSEIYTKAATEMLNSPLTKAD